MGKYHVTSVTVSQSHDKSHDGCGKIVHRPCSSCISSVQEIEEDSIEFFLSTQTWRVIKLSQAKLLHLWSFGHWSLVIFGSLSLGHSSCMLLASALFRE